MALNDRIAKETIDAFERRQTIVVSRDQLDWIIDWVPDSIKFSIHRNSADTFTLQLETELDLE